MASEGTAESPSAAPDRLGARSSRPAVSRLALLDDARAILSRSAWQDVHQQGLSRECQALIAKLKATCPQLVVERRLKAGEVLGDVPIDSKSLQRLFTAAAGGRETPRTVWSDGTNELLVEVARISVTTTDGILVVTIPVACNETGAQLMRVPFATGSAESPAGLIVATDTPDGPPEILAIWADALTALAWTLLLRTLSSLAGAAGSDQDGAGLIASGLSADANGVTLLVMARHEMDRVVK